MTKEMPPGAMPWQIATKEDINLLVQNGEVDRAKEWCRLKLRAYEKLLSDIDDAKAEARTETPEGWEEKRQAIAAEVREWTELFDTLNR